MHYELSQSFFFEAAHTLRRKLDDAAEVAGSRRIHGHTYHAEICVRGAPEDDTGMVVDLAILRTHIAALRSQLDHHYLDEVPGLGQPTLENLCGYIAREIQARGVQPAKVRVWRPSSGDGCTLTL
ncbi:MAG: 6-pyruvoyl tetrahydropterin synthase family protein [Brachymonas sp.]|uniref:6-pyruvoyl trahydropterin synthase family protein n=1 Tax=unclassified Brachymonas TaxID=2621329 RepID=UPI0035B14EDB